MDQDLLARLLAAFPPAARRAEPGDDALIIRGYRIAADTLDDPLTALLTTAAPTARAA
jgi:hypothetical protein